MNCTASGFFATYDCCMSTLYLNMFGSVTLATPSSVHDSETATLLLCIPQHVRRQPLVSMIFISCLSYVSAWNAFCIRTYIQVYGHVYINKCVYTCVHVHAICMCTYTYACVHVCVYVHASERRGSTGYVHTRACTLLWRTTVQKVEEQPAHEHAPSADWSR